MLIDRAKTEGVSLLNGRKCVVEKETTKHIIQCEVVKEKLKKDKSKMWMNGKTQDIRKITKLIKSILNF